MTKFSKIYNAFLSQITDDLYLELTEQETYAMMQDLLIQAIPMFEFPRFPIYDYEEYTDQETGDKYMAFNSDLENQQINILAMYMIVNWLGQQLASVELTRQKYSGSDFKITSAASHMQKLLAVKKDYERMGFHLQRLYKRRKKDINGVYHSTFGKIMEPPTSMPTSKGGRPV